MALAFFDELEGGIISIIDVVAKFGKNQPQPPGPGTERHMGLDLRFLASWRSLEHY